MTYLAKIENGVVVQVIVATSADWAERVLSGTWVSTEGKRYPGIGWSYDGVDFVPPENLVLGGD